MAHPEDIIATLSHPGAVIVMATDTVYGLVAKASDRQAVDRLYGLKQRQAKPGTLISLDIDQLVALGFTRRYLVAVSQFWPGAVSVIVPCGNKELGYLLQHRPDIAIRIPKDQTLATILSQTGPLITTSANLPNLPPADNIAQARAYFNNSVDAYFDGGDLSARQPSTIIKIIDDAIEVVRQGAVKIE